MGRPCTTCGSARSGFCLSSRASLFCTSAGLRQFSPEESGVIGAGDGLSRGSCWDSTPPSVRIVAWAMLRSTPSGAPAGVIPGNSLGEALGDKTPSLVPELSLPPVGMLLILRSKLRHFFLLMGVETSHEDVERTLPIAPAEADYTNIAQGRHSEELALQVMDSQIQRSLRIVVCFSRIGKPTH